jgi:hypothetical protein
MGQGACVDSCEALLIRTYMHIQHVSDGFFFFPLFFLLLLMSMPIVRLQVGDTPICGAGNYANNATCAVSGTGHGEFFMRYLAAFRVSAIMEYTGASVVEAADQVVHKVLKDAGGEGTSW